MVISNFSVKIIKIMEEVLILDFKDNEGKRFVFSKKNFDKHSKYHPELKDKEYFKTIVNLICNSHLQFHLEQKSFL